MKKIIFLNPPLYFIAGRPYALDVSVPPLGLLYLASYLNQKSKEFKALVFDIPAENLTLKEIGQRLNRLKPFAIGITAMTAQLQGAVDLAQFIKNSCRFKTKIFLGGPHLSADPDFIYRFGKLFDYGISGEAEKTFFDSIHKLKQKKTIPKIQKAQIVENLDYLPFPDKKLIKRKLYNRCESLLFSRGCPYQCYYCSRPAISKKIRYRSVDNLIKEIKAVYPFCQGKIDFQDDTFTLNKEIVWQFCQVVKKESLKLDWHCNTRVDLVDQKLLQEMKEAGCSLIHFGIEAGSEKIRKTVVKKGNFSNKQIYQVFRWCQQLKIKTGAYFILGHPQEGKKEIAQTKKMIFNLPLNLLGLSLPTPFPGSPLYQLAQKQGIINQKLIDNFAQGKLGKGYRGVYPVYISPKLNKNYLYEEMKTINRKFYLNFQTFYCRFKEDLTSWKQFKRDIKDLFFLIFKGVSSRKPYFLNP